MFFRSARSGESKVTWKQYVEYLGHLARLRSRGRIGRLQQKLPLKMPVKRFIRYSLVGLSGVLVDMAVLYLLSEGAGLALTAAKSLPLKSLFLTTFCGTMLGHLPICLCTKKDGAPGLNGC